MQGLILMQMTVKKTKNPVAPRRTCAPVLAAAAILILILSTACGSKKAKVPEIASSPSRMVVLPFNVPAGNNDLRWTAMAAPILMAKAGGQSQSLQIIPLYEAMPVAIQAAGASRSFTAESATNIANWMSAKWCAMGEFAPSKRGLSMTVDFLPAKSNLVPFRYLKSGSIDGVGNGMPIAFAQFIRYLAAGPLVPEKGQSMTSLRDLAQALDREYGWFADAEPGKAQEVVANLARSDERLARLLFDPSMYPVLAAK
jgi:hypothetical protein